AMTFDKTQLTPLFKQILLAVQQCHQFDLIHRDIKMENLLINNNSIVLIDFGLTVPFQSIRKPTLTSVANTIHYRPPECLFLKKWPYDQKIDIWAVGCVFYKILTGSFISTHFTSIEVRDDIFKTLGTP